MTKCIINKLKSFYIIGMRTAKYNTALNKNSRFQLQKVVRCDSYIFFFRSFHLFMEQKGDLCVKIMVLY